MIKRNMYITELLKYKDKNFVKAITGLKRVGKTTLLDLYIEELKQLGVNKNNILQLNFELPDTFENIKDNYPKYVLSLDTLDFTQNGMIHKNIEDFLLEDW